jgi:dihydroorotate dehydrogenase
MIYGIAKRFLFRLDAEEAHELVADQMERMQSHPMLLAAVRRIFRSAAPGPEPEAWGLRFGNPLGIAAGFDKNARLIDTLDALGFGFIEVGTVTLNPQPGNPKPRLFRYPEQRALINRLGFNNDGAAAVARRLQEHWDRPGRLETTSPLLVNIGKNRDVGLEDAAEAYLRCYQTMAPWADGVVVNVSSPNTPGLRDLQRPEQMRQILLMLREARSVLRPLRGGEHPIIVKIAPDLDDHQLAEIAGVCRELADGMTATNTTLDRAGMEGVTEAGGLSGDPLYRKSTSILRRLRLLVGPEWPLIGVGGISSGRDAAGKLQAGATLLQAYSGFVFEGPGFARKIVNELALMRDEDARVRAEEAREGTII